MKCKKVLCGIIAAALVTGTFQGSVVTLAAQNVTVKETVAVNATAERDFTFDSSTATITKYVGSASDVTIPSTIGGVAVKVIGEDAFASNTTVTSVVIPKGVTTIEAEAFLNCPNLRSVKIPNGVTSIGEVAFFKCTGLEEVVFGSGVEKIAESCFYGCSALREINIPNTVKEIGSGAFMGCTSLTYVAIPNSVTTIKWGAFQNCSELTEISIPSTVTEIGEEILAGVTGAKITCERGSVAQEYARENDITSNVVSKVDNVTPEIEIEEEVTPTPTAVTQEPEKVPTEEPTKVPTKEPTKAPQPVKYNINYVANGGTIKGNKVTSYDGKSNVQLPKIIRKGYTFGGWYIDSSYKTKVVVLKKGSTGNKTFYAKWIKVNKPSKPTISSVKNQKSKQMTVKLKKKISGAKGYQMVYANKKSFSGKKTVSFTGTSKTVKSLKKGKTYYVKVRAYKVDSANNKVYGSYSGVKKVTIKK
ncbi:MAG: leucine-rich repeat protein [Lachnospiraceae bacterium]|nr:leucine-rich repeat protein [Lachnospiraceae bacterium]